MTAYNGFSSSGKASVYDTSDNLLGTTDISGTVAGTFFGWENTGGIAKVSFHSVPTRSYIQFDNLGFGVAPVPVPAAIWLFGSALAGMGLLGRRKHAT